MTLNEILRACFILFTPSASHSAHLWCSLEPLLSLLANFKSRRFFPSSAPVFQRQCSSATWILWVFRPFPLNTTPTTGPSAAPDLQHGLCKCSTRSCSHHTDERPNASESISVSHERPKRSLERAYGGSRCDCLEVSFEREWMNMLWIQLLQKSLYSL